MAVWFEGDTDIDCTIEQVARALENPGELFSGVTSLMPGLTSVELVEQGGHSLTIKTNEGLMKRTNISKRIDAESVVVEFDEEYAAGSKVTATSHFSDEFTTTDSGVKYRLVMSDVEAPGLLGFFYQRFGSSKTGNAFLTAYKAHLEKQPK
jgi:carbon monoxide dehydrogenase subunit G